jgi:hypothetical protein
MKNKDISFIIYSSKDCDTATLHNDVDMLFSVWKYV